MDRTAQTSSKPSKPRLMRTASLVVRIALGAVLFFGAVGVFQFLVATKTTPERKEEIVVPMAVRVVTVQPVPVAQEWKGYGVARAMHEAVVSAEVAGVVRVRSSAAYAGKWVEQGDLLVAIDDADYVQAKIEIKEALAGIAAELSGVAVEESATEESLSLVQESVELAKADLLRLETAKEKGAARQTEVDRQRAAVTRVEREATELQRQLDLLPVQRRMLQSRAAAQRARLDRAQRDIARATVAAPLAGLLQEVMAEVGERLGVGSPVAKIVDLRQIEVPLRVPVSAAGALPIGAEVELHSGTDVWKGSVGRIAPEAQEHSRTATVFVEIAQAQRVGPRTLMPGRFVTATVRAASAVPTFVLPRHAVRDDRALVVGADGVVEGRDVRIDRHIDAQFPMLDAQGTQWAVVVSGLAVGDRVIVSNLDKVTPGVVVEPKDAAATSTQAIEPAIEPAIERGAASTSNAGASL